MDLKEIITERIKNLFEEYDIFLEMVDITEKELAIKVFNSRGVSYGVFRLKHYTNCFEPEDVILYIKEQLTRKYPEIFTKGK